MHQQIYYVFTSLIIALLSIFYSIHIINFKTLNHNINEIKKNPIYYYIPNESVINI